MPALRTGPRRKKAPIWLMQLFMRTIVTLDWTFSGAVRALVSLSELCLGDRTLGLHT